MGGVSLDSHDFRCTPPKFDEWIPKNDGPWKMHFLSKYGVILGIYVKFWGCNGVTLPKGTNGEIYPKNPSTSGTGCRAVRLF